MENQPIPQLLWGNEIAQLDASGVDWVWDGFIARGNLTLLTSQWKSGKTTLVALLLARRETGGSLAGHSVKPGKTIVVTEEHPSLWATRMRRYHFGPNVCFFARPFKKVPAPEEWRKLVERIRTVQEENGVDLLVVDPLAPFLPCENNATAVLEALLPLRELTAQQTAVLVLQLLDRSGP